MQRVYLVPHDPRWAEAFAREAAAVKDALGGALSEIHHIGSTAISGICAKPIIDLLGATKALALLDANVARLEALGYEAMGEFGIAGRRYFRKTDSAGERTHQIHVFETSSPQIARHLAFRDFLRAHPDCAREYDALKQRLAAANPNDISRYTDGKDEFIREVDAQAAVWVAMRPTFRVHGLDHVQLAMPAGQEDRAREFYVGILGLTEIPKPANLARRGGAWFAGGTLRVHLGVEADFRPARKAHPAFLVEHLAAMIQHLQQKGVAVITDEPLEGYRRVYVADPFGNRLELLEPAVS